LLHRLEHCSVQLPLQQLLLAPPASFPSVASLRPAKPATPNQQLPPRSACGHPGWNHKLAGLF
jgi:hypothetical protein